MNRYGEMKKRHRKEINALPLGFAFGNEQFDEMMRRWGLDPDKDLDKIYSIGDGGYIQKKDAEQLFSVTKKHDREMKEAIMGDLTGDGFICEMFFYELNYHEYGYTGDTSETLAALGYDSKQIESDGRLKHGLEKAKASIGIQWFAAEALEIPASSTLHTEKKDSPKAAASRDATHEMER